MNISPLCQKDFYKDRKGTVNDIKYFGFDG